MQSDLHQFLASLAGAIAMTLMPVVLIVFLCMPSSMHHHVGKHTIDPYAPAAHMT